MSTDGTRMDGLSPDDHPDKLLHRNITEAVIGAAFEVHNVLGYGFLEKVYQKSLQTELIQRGLVAEIEHLLRVTYKGIAVGEYFADLLVEQSVIVELKVASELNRNDEPQLLNQLKITGIRVGLLINFGRSRVEHLRRVV